MNLIKWLTKDKTSSSLFDEAWSEGINETFREMGYTRAMKGAPIKMGKASSKQMVHCRMLTAEDESLMQLIAEWYQVEWNIPIGKTFAKLKEVVADPSQCHCILLVNDVPVSTAGVHHAVNLTEQQPDFRKYDNWLALVYTLPGKRGRGFGRLLCQCLEEHAKKTGVNKLYLFTDTAEPFYQRQGWKAIQHLKMNARNIAVMSKAL